jgi:hypothetical protein
MTRTTAWRRHLDSEILKLATFDDATDASLNACQLQAVGTNYCAKTWSTGAASEVRVMALPSEVQRVRESE